MTSSHVQQDLAAVAAQLGLLPPPVPAPRDRAAAPGTKRRLPPAVRKAAADALAGYRASPEYSALIADNPDLNLFELQSRLGAALNGPHFAPMLQLLRDPDSFEIDPLDFIPKAVSLGVLAQAVLIVGLSGSAGYVMNVDLSNPQPSIYAGGAVDAGIDAGLEGDVCLGFWIEDVDGLNGFYEGEEVDIDDGTGVTEAAFLKGDDPGLLFVGIDLGIDDGMEGVFFYFFHFGIGRAPIYQSNGGNYLVQFNTITCNNSKDDYDTISLNFYQDSYDTEYRFPAWNGNQMAEQGNNSKCYQWDMGLIATFNSSLTLYLQVGDHQMPVQTIGPGNFSGVGGTCTVPFTDKTSAFDEISYSAVVTLLKN
jgi:hypothetical protein